MAEIILLEVGPRAPDELATFLRELADKVDGGEITALVACFLENDNYCPIIACPLTDGLVLANLLHDETINRFKV